MKFVLSFAMAAVCLFGQAAPVTICTAIPVAGCVQQDPALDRGVISSAQDPSSANYGTAFQNVIPNTVKLTDAIYTASKPSEVQALLAMQPGAARYTQALALAEQGYTIDLYSDAWGNDPVVTMILRTNYGILWTAPMLTASPIPTPQNPSMNPAPGANLAGWIKTSLNPADYPAFYPPPPPPPPIGSFASPIVGNFEGTVGNCQLYGAGAGAIAAVASGTIKAGTPYTAGGTTFNVNVSTGLMGESISFCAIP